MNVPYLHQRACNAFAANVHKVREDQWAAPTPCSEWDVRTLVNHLVYEDRWTAPMFAGKTIAEVGDAFEGDLLGADPVRACDEAVAEAVRAVQDEGAMERTVHLSFGDCPGSEYAMQMFADHLIHGWDLATAIGADTTLDPELVDACLPWFVEREEAYRTSGAIAARPQIPDDVDPQTRLLAMFGRRS